MRLLVVSGRFPEAGAKGDQSRTFALVRDLSRRHEITVVAGATPSSPAAGAALAAHARVVVRPAPLPAHGLAAALALLQGVPAQVGWMMPRRTWRAVLRAAPEHDVALVVTARSLRGPLPIPLVLDHVDALSLNMQRRARGPEAFHRRLAARLEARLLHRWERRSARWAAAQLVTSGEDAEHLPAQPPMTIVPVAWDGPIDAAAAGGDRDLDVILTGNMAYPPNRDAAAWLDRGIAPALARLVPGAEAWVVGRGAAAVPLARVRVASDVPDLHAWLRRARVAVVPLRIGTGSPYKLLEAAACGAAVVSTAWAQSRFDLPCAVAETSEEFAAAIARLLADEPARRAQAEAALVALQEHATERTSARVERLLAGAAAR